MWDHMDEWGMGFMGGGMLVGLAIVLLLGVVIGILIARR